MRVHSEVRAPKSEARIEGAMIGFGDIFRCVLGGIGKLGGGGGGFGGGGGRFLAG